VIVVIVNAEHSSPEDDPHDDEWPLAPAKEPGNQSSDDSRDDGSACKIGFAIVDDGYGC
jgi:hypothetical protein